MPDLDKLNTNDVIKEIHNAVNLDKYSAKQYEGTVHGTVHALFFGHQSYYVALVLLLLFMRYGIIWFSKKYSAAFSSAFHLSVSNLILSR